MINPRELGLAETIKNKLIGIQKSQQINKQLSKLDKKILKMNGKEVERVSKIVASKVHKFCMRTKSSGKPLTAEMINQRVRKELEKI
jgi:hypothetical protein